MHLNPGSAGPRRFSLPVTLATLERTAVTFELGREVGTTPTQLDATLIALIEDTAGALGIATRRMPTVGHDAAMFVRAGIPSAVILVRNANGSHNSDEALDREDFAGGVHVLDRAMHRLANARE